MFHSLGPTRVVLLAMVGAMALRARVMATTASSAAFCPLKRYAVPFATATKTRSLRPSASAFVSTTTTTTTNTNTNRRQQQTIIQSSSSSSSSSSVDAAPPLVVNSRLSRGNLSLEVKSVVQNLDVVLSHLQARRASDETLEAARTIAALQEQRVALIQTRDTYLNQRKEASAVVGALLRQQKEGGTGNGVDLEQQMEQAKQTSTTAAEGAQQAEDQLATLQATMDQLLAILPNLLDDVVPDGSDSNENVMVSEWGDVQALPKRLGWASDFVPKWHDDVALGLNGYAQEAAVQMSGSRFVALTGHVAQLERALGMWLMDVHTQQHGYTEVSVPFVVGTSALFGTSQLPKFQEDLFAISPNSHTCNGENAYLIPTAEVPVTNLHAQSVLDIDQLPLCYVAWTPCFRAEAGSYGRDTKGLIRTHQFHKVELVKITTAETSNEEHELLTQHAERILQLLELPYRKMRLCSGDIGFAARHCYDLEVWLPGAKEYREISSCSNTGDFQARRMSLRYRPEPQGTKKAKKPEWCHTINGSGLAVGRTLVAVLENYQLPDGRVVVPEVLRPYMGGKEILEPRGIKSPPAATQ